ncbi:MAG TPA: cytochrome c [Candidatus Acidoferrum sp.]|jgi:mono/diheme cytochrome c family protein|nr:cytochrome c [Candidatus Acidoferrum sp.]
MRIRGLAIAALLIVAVSTASGCRKHRETVKADPLLAAYDSEPDWNDSTKMVSLGYEQAQGKRVFYQYCVWCHAEATPAGPSNRSNLTPVPPLLADGSTLNAQSDNYLETIITLGGSAMGKSAMMPPYGRTLSPEEIRSVIAFTRAIAQPPYQPPGRPGSQYSPK